MGRILRHEYVDEKQHFDWIMINAQRHQEICAISLLDI